MIDHEKDESFEPDYIPVVIDGDEGILNLHNNKVFLFKEIHKPVNRMSVLERFNYRKQLIDELDNPFNDLEDLQHIEDKLMILDRYEGIEAY